MKYDKKMYPACTVPAPEAARVKGLGCVRNKLTPDCFNVRTITRNGKITVAEMRAIADAAETYGNGQVAFTTRQTAEIQCVPYEDLEPLFARLAEAGLTTGGTGAKVRPVVSCKGTTCVFGLIDTYGLSEKIHHLYYVGYHGVKLPHKFKIAVGGCANNCVKPSLNDIGIIGRWVPALNTELCRGCGACVKACPVDACRVEEKKYVRDAEKCLDCGRCVRACPAAAIEYTPGYQMTVGGRWGKRIAHGQPLSHLFTTEEEILAAVEKAILLFRDKGLAGERFADTVSRLSLSETERLILSDELLARKTEILAKE